MSFFLNGWQDAVENVFLKMPKAGVVCTTPGTKSYGKDLGMMFFDFLFSKKLKFRQIRDKKALSEFIKSVGAENLYKDIHLEYYLTLKNNDCEAVAGAAHFTATYRGDVFEKMNIKFSDYKLGGNSEFLILDEPPLKKGYYRYSTIDNYTFHLGNRAENWMIERESEIVNNNFEPSNPPKLPVIKERKLKYLFVKHIWNRFIFNKRIICFLLVLKGLSFDEAKMYLQK